MTTAFRRSKKYESLNHNNNTKCKGRILVDNLKHFTHLRLHVYNTSLLPTNRNYVTYGLENYKRRRHSDKYIIDINIWYVSIKKRTYNFSGNPETRQILLKGTSLVVFLWVELQTFVFGEFLWMAAIWDKKCCIGGACASFWPI